jgi:16S rRNA (guanine1207-N2)-methyltransferase
MITTKMKNIDLIFQTSNKLFSPNYIDHGTLAMLSVVEFKENDKVLDLGCGYGVVGILAAKIIGANKVVMSDVDEEAIKLSKENAALNNVPDIKIIQSDGFKNIQDNDFTLILCNPPLHVDFSVPKMLIEKGFNRLCLEDRMFFVTKRKVWYRNKMINVFGGVKVWKKDGYYVFMSVKKEIHYADKKPVNKKKKIT